MKQASDLKLYEFNRKYGWWGTPNFEKRSFHAEYNRELRIFHDSFGNRSPYEANAPKFDQAAFVFLGGSHTWGGGVENFETYPAIFGELSKYPVLNLGHCSFGLDQILLVFMNLVDKIGTRSGLERVFIELHPWVIHRVLRKSALGYPKPFFEVIDNQIRLRTLSTIQANPLIRKYVGEYYLFEKSYREYKSNIELGVFQNDELADPIFVLWKQNYYKQMYILIEKLLELFAQISTELKIELSFILGPTRQELNDKFERNHLINPSMPRRILRQCFDRIGLNYVDLLANFKSIQSHADQGMYPDGHINVLGHSIFAKKLHKEFLNY